MVLGIEALMANNTDFFCLTAWDYGLVSKTCTNVIILKVSPILLCSNLIYGFRNICLVKCHLEQDLNIRQSGEEDEKDAYRQRGKPE